MRMRFALLGCAGLLFVTGCDQDPNDLVSDSASRVTQVADTTGFSDEPLEAPDGFEAPIRIKAGDEFVAVESPGYACPTLADVDGDGRVDLVVGQFNQGHMQLCRNTAATDSPPQFAAAEWIQSGSDRAIVPGVW